jgi:hypothetical protein
MPASFFSAFSRSAADAPSREEVLPVTMVPSCSWIAAAGPSVSSAFVLAATITGRLAGVRFACFISTSSLCTVPLVVMFSRCSQSAV